MEVFVLLLVTALLVGLGAAFGMRRSAKKPPLFTIYVNITEAREDRLVAVVSRETYLFKLHETVEIVNVAAGFPETSRPAPGQEWELSFYVMRGNSPTVITAESAKLTWVDLSAADTRRQA